MKFRPIMSNHVAKSDPGNDGAARQSMNPYQASWMDRWKQASHKPSSEVHSHGLKKDDRQDSKQHLLLLGHEMATDVLNYPRGFGEVSEATLTIDTMKKSLKTGPMKLGKEVLDGKPLPMFPKSGNMEMAISSKNNVATFSNSEPVKYHIDLNNAHTMGRGEWPYPEMEFPSRECKPKPEGISQVPELLTKSHEVIEDNILAVPPSLGDDVGSSSKIVPYVMNSGVAPMESFIDQSSAIVASKENSMGIKFCSYSTFWLNEKKADSLLECRQLGSSSSKQNDAPLLLHGRSTNNGHLCSFLDEQNQKVENNSTTGLLPSLGFPEAMKPEKAYYERFLLPSMPRSVHFLKTTGIIDSVGEKPGGVSKVSQTTHQFFITKKTGVNLTEGGKVLSDAKLKGNMLNEFLSLSPSFCYRGQQGVKLQPLDSSADSAEKDNLGLVGDFRTSTVCLKNESSVETDAMELDVFQKNNLSGVALCPSDQIIKGVHNSLLCDTENSTGKEAGNKVANTELPDMNERLLALPDGSNSVGGGTSTSRTQSLDAEHLFHQAEQPSTSNTTACPDRALGQDPSSRWVKRLKLSTTDPFAHGTKSSKLGEVSSRKKVSKMFSKMTDCGTSSEPMARSSRVRSQEPLDQTAMLFKNGDSTSSDSVRKSQEISLSSSWIHRWCRHKATSRNKKPEAVVLCEPRSSKVELDELQKKQFPSIAAMALMGKAMSGFQPCEFRRRGLR